MADERQRALELLTGASDRDAALAAAQEQQTLARLLRGEAPQMRQAGAFTVAPHWMELIGQLAKEYVSGRSRSAAQEQLAKANAIRDQMRARTLEQLFPKPEEKPSGVISGGSGFSFGQGSGGSGNGLQYR